LSTRAWLAASLIASMAGSASRADDAPRPEVLLRGGLIVDGTGAPGRVADLLIRDGRIAAVGAVEPGPGARVVDASGLVVAPGFIDLHSHSDAPIVAEATRDNRNFQLQGVTTVVTGNCGGGTLDVAGYFERIDRDGAGTNVIHLVPLGEVRKAVLGTADRRADAEQLRAMAEIVERQMGSGAWGVSSGLIYVPGRYADTAELVALAKVAARHGGIYASHVRDEGAGLLRSIDEALAVGEVSGAPVHISHLKASGKKNWGLTAAACQRIEGARAAGRKVSADQYPYLASSTSLAAMVIPDWALQGDAEEFSRIADDPTRGPRLRSSIERDLAGRDGGGSIRIARFPPDPSLAGKDLATIAREHGTSAVDLVIDIQRRGGAQAISFGMGEDDVRRVMKKPYVATASDGSAHRQGLGDRPHPRSYGTFPRKFRYALDEGLMTIEDAVRSCSGLPAEILGLADRGKIQVGAVADLVAFDPATFRDQATFDDPTRYAAGVRHLFVNGVAVVDGGEPKPALPGRAIRLGGR
jgi:N-acyl-D-amino-acid deacylase